MNEAADMAIRDCPICSEPMLALEGEWWCLPCQEVESGRLRPLAAAPVQGFAI